MNKLKIERAGVAFFLDASSLLEWAIFRSGISEMTQVRTKVGAEILLRSEMGK